VFEEAGENFKWTITQLNNLSKLSIGIDSHILKAIKTNYLFGIFKNENAVSLEISKNIYISQFALGVKTTFQVKNTDL
jgi:hypothetical protein